LNTNIKKNNDIIIIRSLKPLKLNESNCKFEKLQKLIKNTGNYKNFQKDWKCNKDLLNNWNDNGDFWIVRETYKFLLKAS
jgi:hypothetical protein